MTRPPESPRFIVLCPLAHEAKPARAAARALRTPGGNANIQITITGPGGAAVRACLQRILVDSTIQYGSPSGTMPPVSRPIPILFGTCGGLRRPHPDTAAAPAISEVIDESGRRWAVPMRSATALGNNAVLLSVKSPLFSIESKHAASSRFNADLVDCESAAFAEACESASVRWGIVRGISDAWNESLPEQAATWIDPRGTTRITKVLTDCLTHPSLIPRVIRLGRQSSAALRAAGEQLRAMILTELRSATGENHHRA
jgi:hypothetical protein